MLPIIKNVAPPKAARTVNEARRKYPFAEMEPGDMFFLADRQKNTLATHASTVGKKLGKKFMTRLVRLVEDPADSGLWREPVNGEKGVLGIGVWCIEPEAKPVEEAPAERTEAAPVTKLPTKRKKAA